MRWFNFRKVGLTAGAIAAVGSGFVFSERSKGNLIDVCPTINELAHCVIQETTVDFIVIEGMRSKKRQSQLYAIGRTEPGKKVTWTLNSRHMTGRAIDIAALKNGEIDWNPASYKEINKAFEKCSNKLDIPYVWGGTFKGRDWGHFETNQCFMDKKDADV